jgi:chemotaxis protein CheX
MKVQIVNRYVQAALDVMSKETGNPVGRGVLHLQGNPYTTEDVTAVIGISGQLTGSVYLSMAEQVALRLISDMLGQDTVALDDLGQSGIAEMANVIAGLAGTNLESDGITTTINPPLVLVGRGARLSTVAIQRLVVPLTTSCGDVNLHVSLREAA